MKFILVYFSVIFLSFTVQAVEFEVGKVSKSGKKAVIYIPDGQTLEKGQILKFGGESTSKTVMTQSGVSVRNWSVRGEIAITQNESSTENAAGVVVSETEQNTTRFLAGVSKNLKSFEVGGHLIYDDSSTKTVNNTSFGAGFFAEYNFIKNIPGASFVPHIGLGVGYLSGEEETNTAQITENSGIYYEAYGGLKYFLVPASGFAITADIFYKSDSSGSVDPLTTTTTSIGLRAGVRYYF